MCAGAALRRDDPRAVRPGSLLRRRGGGYFCAEHLPLETEHLAKRRRVADDAERV